MREGKLCPLSLPLTHSRAEGHAGSRVQASPPPLPVLPPSNTHPSSSPCSRQYHVGNRSSISLETKTFSLAAFFLVSPICQKQNIFYCSFLVFSILASDLDAALPPPQKQKKLAKVCLLTKLSRQILVLVVLHCVHS